MVYRLQDGSAFKDTKDICTDFDYKYDFDYNRHISGCRLLAFGPLYARSYCTGINLSCMIAGTASAGNGEH